MRTVIELLVPALLAMVLASPVVVAAEWTVEAWPLPESSVPAAQPDLVATADGRWLLSFVERRAHGAHALRFARTRGNGDAGWDDTGTLEAGARADFTTIALDSVRTAGPLPRPGAETAVFAATAADVRHTVVAGRHIVRDGAHQLVPDVPQALSRAVEALRS